MKPPVKRLAIAVLSLLAAVVTYGAIGSPFWSIALEKTASAQEQASSPTAGIVTMIDLGATKCIPCKMMAPILEALKTEYAGRANIFFIDVWENPRQAKKYGVRIIPTQIFFDKSGKEAYRHTGFMDRKSIIEVLTKLGVS